MENRTPGQILTPHVFQTRLAFLARYDDQYFIGESLRWAELRLMRHTQLDAPINLEEVVRFELTGPQGDPSVFETDALSHSAILP